MSVAEPEPLISRDEVVPTMFMIADIAADVELIGRLLRGPNSKVACRFWARSISRSGPTDNRRKDRMAFTFKLDHEDGTPADAPLLHTATAAPSGTLETRFR
jgi:hypothetical protein